MAVLAGQGPIPSYGSLSRAGSDVPKLLFEKECLSTVIYVSSCGGEELAIDAYHR
jgi:hypothetical protein